MKNEPSLPQEVPLSAPSSQTVRAPRAFALGEGKDGKNRPVIEETPDFTLAVEGPQPEIPPAAAGWLSLGSVFWAAASVLVALYLAESGWALVQSLATKAPWLGQSALVLLAIVALGFVLFLGREVFALFRQKKVARLRLEAEALAILPLACTVRAYARKLSAFYAGDPASAQARAELGRVLDEIHDPGTLLGLTERVLLKGKDDAARQAITLAAQRVSVVTALSPRAIVDVAFVLAQSVILIRRLSTIYGGRASGLGLLRLSGRVLAHLALTGSAAIADQFLSQIVGAGLAARLSARLGEGVLNGVLTARVGIAALDLCRPMPFRENPAIMLSEVVVFTGILERVAEKPAG